MGSYPVERTASPGASAADPREIEATGAATAAGRSHASHALLPCQEPHGQLGRPISKESGLGRPWPMEASEYTNMAAPSARRGRGGPEPRTGGGQRKLESRRTIGRG